MARLPGCGFRSNRITAQRFGQNLFLRFGIRPLQRESTTATLTVNVANTTAILGALVNPGHQILYTAGATDFIGLPQEGQGHGVRIGGYLVTGRVVDAKGAPVAGAAIRIGDVVCYSDRDGNFQERFRKDKPQPVEVLLSEFAAPGKWRVIFAPATAAPGSSIEIIRWNVM